MTLTPHQIRIVQFLSDGKTTSEIAQILGCSEQTVKNTRYVIYQKLQVNSLALMIRWAIREGIVTP